MSILPPQDLLTLRANNPIEPIRPAAPEMDALKQKATAGMMNPEKKEEEEEGKSGEEPVAGEQGQGSVSEPYDQGNAEGKEGAPAKEGGMTGALDDTKRKAAELMGKGT